jgi:hypothetical protein
MAACDHLAGQQSLAAAGQVIVTQYAAQVDYVGTSYIPRTGAVLICANHPGMVDASALFVAINRPDVLVIAADRPVVAGFTQCGSAVDLCARRSGWSGTGDADCSAALAQWRGVVDFSRGAYRA